MKNPKMRSIMPTWSAKKMWEIRHAKNRHTLRTPTNKITVARSDGTVIEWMRPVASKKSPVANCAIAQATAARTTRRKPRPAPRRAERKTAAMTNKSRRVMCTAVSYLCSRMPSAYQGAGSCFLARRPAGLRQNWSRFGAGHARAQPRNIAPFSCPSAFWILPISQSPARFHTSKLQEIEEEPLRPPVSSLAFRSFCRLASA